MTTSYRRTRQCWGGKTTTAASLRSPCGKAADSEALIHSIQLNAPLLSAQTPDRELGATRHVFILDGVNFTHLMSSLGGAKRRSCSEPSVPGGGATPSARFIYAESRSAASLPYLSPLCFTGPLLSHQLSGTHTHTHTHTITHTYKRGRAASLQGVRTPTRRTAAPLPMYGGLRALNHLKLLSK